MSKLTYLSLFFYKSMGYFFFLLQDGINNVCFSLQYLRIDPFGGAISNPT
jgi:hypothetical protein